MKRIKGILVMIFTIAIVFANSTLVKADNNILSGNTLGNHSYLYANESPKDYMNYFSSIGKDGWQPRIKYVGSDADHIDYYLFCLSFEKLAPISSVSYTSNTISTIAAIDKAQYAYAYIIENGFYYRDHSGSYEDLLWDYYITSMAIYQYQYDSQNLKDNSFKSIRDFNTNDTIAKRAIIQLADGAKNIDATYKKFVQVYNPSNPQYQKVTPALIYEIEEDENDEPIIETNPAIQINYKHKCDNNYVDAKIQLIDSNNNVVATRYSKNGTFLIGNVSAGQYTVKDISNNVSYNITVKDQKELQTYNLVLDEVCDVPEEKIVVNTKEETTDNPKTAVVFSASAVTIGIGLAIAMFIYSKKYNKFKI